MNESQILQEIDIIIRAKIDNAKKEINDIKKDVKNMAKTISQEFKEVNKNSNFDNINKELQQYKNNLKEVTNQTRKIKVNIMGDTSFSFDPNIKDDFKKQYDNLIEKLEKQETKELETTSKITPKVEMSNIESKVNELKKNISNIDNVKININSNPISNIIQENIKQVKTLQDEFSKLELKGINGYEVMSLKDSLTLLKEEIINVSPLFSNIRGDLRQACIDGENSISNLSNMFLTLKTGASSSIGMISNKAKELGGNLNNSFTNIKEKASNVFQPYIKTMENAGTVGKRVFEEIKEKIGNLGNNISKPIGKLKELVNHFKNTSKTIKDVSKSSPNIGKTLSNGISAGISSIKKFALGLLSVRTAFTIVSRAANSYLSFDNQLQSSIQNSWNMLGSLLAPALEYVAGLFSRLVNVIATFVKMLTGVDLVARANTKAINNQAKATKGLSEANDQLSGIDDIDTLQSNTGSSNGGGGETPQISVGEVDTTIIENIASKLKEIFGKIFDPFKKAWNTTGKSVIDSFKKSLSNIGNAIKGIGTDWLEVWTNGTGQTFLESILKIIKQLIDGIGGIANAFTEAWTQGELGKNLIQALYNMYISLNDVISTILDSFLEIINNGTITETFSLFIEIFTTIFDIIGAISNSLSEAWANAGNGTAIIQGLADIFNVIAGLAKSIADSIKKWVISDGFQEALNKVIGFITDIVKIIEQIANWISDMYDKYVKPIVEEKLLPAIDSIITAIMDVWNAVKPAIENTIEWIETLLEPVIQGLMDFIGGIIDVIKGIADFISGVFTLDWKKAWGGIKTIFKGIWDAIASIVKTPINMIISAVEWLVNKIITGVNWIKKQMNKLSFDIPDWVPLIGGKTFGFNFAMSSEISIPRLKSGHVAREPIVAEIGEYANANTDPEIVSPASMMKQAFRDVLNEFEFGGTRVDRLQINVANKNLFDEVIEYINDENERNGVSVIKEV